MKSLSGHLIYPSVHFGGLSILLTGLPFLTEEQREEAEGTVKPTTVTEDDEKDTNERDNSEGKNSSKDSGKMLDSLPFIFLHPSIPCNQRFSHTLRSKAY